MKRLTYLLLLTVIFWLGAAAMFFRTAFLLGPTTWTWRNMGQPSATFRWATPLGAGATLEPESSRTFTVSVPRAFTQATLRLELQSDSGPVTVTIPAPAGKTATTGNGSATLPATLTMAWDDVAVRTRTFSVALASHETAVSLRRVSFTARR